MKDGLCTYDQHDSRWADVALGDDAQLSLADSGCGIFSFCNAVHALNGSLPDAVELAQWAVAIDAYHPEGAGLYRERLYPAIEKSYGQALGFRIAGQYWGTAGDERLKQHLIAGGTAVAHVPNHFLALVGLDGEHNRYRVLESSCSLLRFLRKDGWVDRERLCRGNTNVDWYVLLAPREDEARCRDQHTDRLDPQCITD